MGVVLQVHAEHIVATQASAFLGCFRRLGTWLPDKNNGLLDGVLSGFGQAQVT